MHELAITENALRIALTEAERHGAQRIAVIRLKVGSMTHVNPESVAFYLELLAKGTPAEGVRLETDYVPLRARCRSCAEEFDVVESRFGCPRCGETRTEVISGRELYVDSIEIE